MDLETNTTREFTRGNSLMLEPDFFQQNVSRIVDDVISQIHASLEIWPTLVEICYYYKDKKPLPQTKVKNKRLETPPLNHPGNQ